LAPFKLEPRMKRGSTTTKRFYQRGPLSSGSPVLATKISPATSFGRLTVRLRFIEQS
jgi:hypothetical protein